MIRKTILTLSVVGLLMGCRDEEKEQALQSEIDSLRTELKSSEQTAQDLQEVGVLIDSIDANRQLLRTDMVEGTSYTDYKSRLKDISAYVKETQTKIADLEKNAKNSRIYSATIKRLKADLEARTKQIAALEQEVQTMRTENQSLSRNITQRDSVINVNTQTIKMREENLAALETKVVEMHTKSLNDQAEAYFSQAQALEEAADRTKFAPRKKKETQREALELYRQAVSLGKSEAEAKVKELEKDLG